MTAWDSTLAEAHPHVLHAGPFARLVQRMALPQTACLALGGPLAVPFAGRAWFPAFDEDGDLIEVLSATRHTDCDPFHHLVIIHIQAARIHAARRSMDAGQIFLLERQSVQAEPHSNQAVEAAARAWWCISNSPSPP